MRLGWLMTYFCGLRCKEQKERTAGIAKLNILVVIGFVVLSAAYLIVTDSLVGKSYQLREIEAKMSQEQEIAKKLANKQTEQSALYNLELAAKELNLITIDKAKYLDAIDSSVALASQINQ